MSIVLEGRPDDSDYIDWEAEEEDRLKKQCPDCPFDWKDCKKHCEEM